MSIVIIKKKSYKNLTKTYDEVMHNLWKTYDDIRGISRKRKIRGKWCFFGKPCVRGCYWSNTL